mmetsp:Transcript_17972/g.30583  ORF Transcript_17972/g.30583 Transcript_17972/m.30583 type:complete len:145 (+) Transcript_17972:687-1121(+)
MVSLNKVKEWNLEPGNPVVSSWISTDGHYGFIEFRTPEEANLGFELQGLKYQDAELRFGRPKAYQDSDPMMGGENEGEGALLPSMNDFTMSIQHLLITGSEPSKNFYIHGPSKILQLKDLASFQLTNRAQSCRELYSDIWHLCD